MFRPLSFRSVPYFLIALGVLTCQTSAGQQAVRYDGPIIDVHLHAEGEVSVENRPCKPAPCTRSPTLATSGAEIKVMTLAAMARNNVVLGLVSDLPARVFDWVEGHDEFVVGVMVETPSDVGLPELRAWLESGRAHYIGEVTAQYAGVPIDDPSLDPLFALAHELDVPVHVHVLGGGGSPDFPVHIGNPLRLVPVLQKYPGLRIQMENAGWPFLEELTALMYQYPSVYADVSTILTHRPPDVALGYVKSLVDNGLGRRIMYGSDQMIWPEVIDEGIELIQSAEFLSVEEKADFFYNNAARFLRLSEEQIASHHRR